LIFRLLLLRPLSFIESNEAPVAVPRDLSPRAVHTGTSQTEAACLPAEDVDWNSHAIKLLVARIQVAGAEVSGQR
jgi:hypothetical protein